MGGCENHEIVVGCDGGVDVEEDIVVDSDLNYSIQQQRDWEDIRILGKEMGRCVRRKSANGGVLTKAVRKAKEERHRKG